MDAVIDSIIRFAESRPDIEYVFQNGSRVNPSIITDKYADYDIVFGCRSFQKYLEDKDWIKEFGNLLILQQNEMEETGLVWPVFLMQFENGVRIDLQFYPGNATEKYHSDSLSKVLLDKTNNIVDIFEASEETYLTRRPSNERYIKEVNNFWWCIINVGKGLARKELTYSRFMYESIVRENFLNIVSWYASLKKDWNINTGKYGKFLERNLDKKTWNKIEKTYVTNTVENFWESIFDACYLVKEIDGEISKALAINIEREKVDEIVLFLERIKQDRL